MDTSVLSTLAWLINLLHLKSMYLVRLGDGIEHVDLVNLFLTDERVDPSVNLDFCLELATPSNSSSLLASL
jgi:hypothetical protein